MKAKKVKKLTEVGPFLEPVSTYYYLKNGDTIFHKSKDNVKIGEIIISNDNNITYASISGTIKISNNLLIINNNFKEIKKNKNRSIKTIFNLDYQKIEGLLKKHHYNYLNDIKNKELIVNLMPYYKDVYCDYYLINNYYSEIFDTLELLRKEFNIEIIILIPKYNKSLLKIINNYSESYPNIKFKYLHDRFPYTNNILLQNKHFHHKETKFINLFEIYKIYNILKKQTILDYKYLNITGSALNNNYLLITKLGTKLNEILSNCIGPNYNMYTYYKNNILLRNEIKNIDDITIDSLDVIYIEKKPIENAALCIKCGKCITKCPYNLDPRKELDQRCIKCGICNLVCPANINLIYKRGNI